MTKSKQLQVIKKDISAQVLAKINIFQQNGELKIPKDYSPENALKSAYLILSETKNKAGLFALSHCSQVSIANALLKMVVWGLSPLKKHCDFIMYGDKLDCSIEYTGNIVLAKRYGNLKWIKANAIFDKDVFEFSVDPMTGRKTITNHEQTIESIGSKVLKGAYAIYELNDGIIDVEIMNMVQIRDAWNQGAMKGNSPAHKNFPDQMSNKTVINRACKLLIRGSDDNILYASKDESNIDVAQADVDHEIETNANKETLEIDIEDAEVLESNQEISIEDTEAVPSNNGVQVKETVDQGPGF